MKEENKLILLACLQKRTEIEESKIKQIISQKLDWGYTVFESILRYQRQQGYAPSIREIGEMVGLASTSSVYNHLKILEEKGYIARKVEAPRAIAIL